MFLIVSVTCPENLTEKDKLCWFRLSVANEKHFINQAIQFSLAFL